MLNSEIDTALEKPSTSIPIPADGMAIDGIKNEHTLFVRVSNCLEYLPESDGDKKGVRTFDYDVTLHFDSRESKDAFNNNPHTTENAATIIRTAEEMMREPLQMENQRDAGGHYGPPGDPALKNTINENTYLDIEIVQQDLGTIFQSTFPNAGITSVTIDNLTAKESACPGPLDPRFADNMTAPPPTPVASVSNGLSAQHYKR